MGKKRSKELIFRRTLKEDKNQNSKPQFRKLRKISKQIKKLKSANKQADIQAFLLSLHSKPLFRKRRFRNIHPKRGSKNISI